MGYVRSEERTRGRVIRSVRKTGKGWTFSLRQSTAFGQVEEAGRCFYTFGYLYYGKLRMRK